MAQFGRPSGVPGAVIAELMHIHHAPDYAAVLPELRIVPGVRVLEIGMGAGFHVKQLTDAGAEYCGIDHSADMVAKAQRNAPAARFLCRDVCAGELPVCDAAMAVNSMQWWRDPLIALRHLRNALVKNGRLVIGIASPPPAGLLPNAGQRHYYADEMRSLMRCSGFRDVACSLLSIGCRPYLIAVGVA